MLRNNELKLMLLGLSFFSHLVTIAYMTGFYNKIYDEFTRKVLKPPLQFIHIPKTGGSSITENAMMHNISWGYCRFEAFDKCPDLQPDKSSQRFSMVLHEYNDKNRRLHPDSVITVPWHYPLPFIVDAFKELNIVSEYADPYKDCDTFTVVRNPYERMISEYYYRASFRMSFAQANKEGNFNAKLTKHLDEAKKDYFYMDGHFIPQFDFVYDVVNAYVDGRPRRIVTHVLKYENLQEDFEKLMKLYDLNVTIRERSNARNETAKLKITNINQKNRRTIESLFAKDFEEFGYEKLS